MSQTTRGPALGLDLGEARIGVALSDPERRVAVPLGTVKVGSPPGELQAVAELVEEHEVGVVVVGLPVSMSGAHGIGARQAASFADALRGVLSVPVELHDERLSTVEAERRLRGAGISRRNRRVVVDRAAAAIVLQAWLDANTAAVPRPHRD